MKPQDDHPVDKMICMDFHGILQIWIDLGPALGRFGVGFHPSDLRIRPQGLQAIQVPNPVSKVDSDNQEVDLLMHVDPTKKTPFSYF